MVITRGSHEMNEEIKATSIRSLNLGLEQKQTQKPELVQRVNFSLLREGLPVCVFSKH